MVFLIHFNTSLLICVQLQSVISRNVLGQDEQVMGWLIRLQELREKEIHDKQLGGTGGVFESLEVGINHKQWKDMERLY